MFLNSRSGDKMFTRLGRCVSSHLQKVKVGVISNRHPVKHVRRWMSSQGAPVTQLSEEETMMKNMGKLETKCLNTYSL